MSISDKTRKTLWGRSGNRCADCRQELVIEGTPADNESVVGEECHIVSGKPNGPRYDSEVPAERLDDPENLILLCRVHHKMVDDQNETFTVQALQELKAKHEKWVASTLRDGTEVPGAGLRRVKENIPSFLIRVQSGREVIQVIAGSDASSFDNEELETDEEVAVVSGFFQEISDYRDIWSELEPGDRVKAEYRITALLRQLEQAGFWVFGAREVQYTVGGVGGPSPWPVAIMKVVRSTSSVIVRLDLTDEEMQK